MNKRLEIVAGTLNLFRPVSFPFLRRRRLGGGADGGYVIFDDHCLGPVFSFSFGGKTTFDADLAVLGRQVYLFDPGYLANPISHLNVNFRRQSLAPQPDPFLPRSEGNYALQQYLDECGHCGRRDLLLKMDLEGAEYTILESLPESTLDQFSQVVVEFHNLSQISTVAGARLVSGIMKKMLKGFSVGHVHANNHAPLIFISGFPFPDVLEVTFVRSDVSSSSICYDMFPTPLDRPNNSVLDDHMLWFFPFPVNIS